MRTDTTIRLARTSDHLALLELWERSVRATHDFLSDEDIASLRPLVAEWLRGETTNLWTLVDTRDSPLGFIGFAGDRIEALFIDADARRSGAGRMLVAHAQTMLGEALVVDVNEQNGQARAFYEALGFEIVGRSPLDDSGRPFPLLHLRRPASSARVKAERHEPPVRAGVREITSTATRRAVGPGDNRPDPRT